MTDITRYMDLRIKPIPRQCPIPPNSVAYIGGTFPDIDDTAGTTYILCKNKQELVIEGPPFEHLPELEQMDEYNRFMLLSEMHAGYLAVIEDLTPTIEFGNTHWAHLVKDPYSGYQIILDYDKQLRRVSCPQWHKTIPIDEVEFTVWGPYSDRRGIWKGKEVDIMYACDDVDMFRVDRVMYALRHLDGRCRGFTFEVLGHLTDSDGQVVGIVSEAAWGRPIGPSDKELVFSEMRRLERYGCIYRGCLGNQFLIADGKLRLIQLACIKLCPNPEQLRRDAAFYHTQHLEDLFQEFEDFGPFGHYRLPPAYLTTSYEEITYLRHPIPRHIISPESMIYLNFFPRSGYTVRDDRGEDDQSIYSVPVVARRPQRRETLRILYPGRSNRGIKSFQDEDAPLSLASFRMRSHPYGRRGTSGRHDTLTDSECTASTIDTIE